MGIISDWKKKRDLKKALEQGKKDSSSNYVLTSDGKGGTKLVSQGSYSTSNYNPSSSTSSSGTINQGLNQISSSGGSYKLTKSRSGGGGMTTQAGTTPLPPKTETQQAVQQSTQQSTQQNLQQALQSGEGGRLQLTQATKDAIERQREEKIQEYRERIGKTLRFPEEKIIKPTLEKIRQTPGTQIVFGTRPGGRSFQIQAEADIRGDSYLITPFNTAGVIDVGTFFIPGISTARTITYTSRVAGNIIENPNYVIKQPLDVLSGVAVGVGGALSSAKSVRNIQQAKDLTALSSSEFKFFQTVNKEKSILNLVGSRTSKDLIQEIGVGGKLLKTESGKVQFLGKGASSTTGEFSTILGLVKQKPIQIVEVFETGSKSIGIKFIESIKGIEFFKGATVSGTINQGERLKDISNIELYKLNKEFTFIKNPSSKGISFEILSKGEPSTYGFRAGRTNFGTSQIQSQESILDISQVVKQIKPSLKPSIPNIKLSGIPMVKAETFTETKTEPIFLPSIKVTPQPQEQITIPQITTITKTNSNQGLRKRSSGKTKSDTITSQSPRVETNIKTDTIQRQSPITRQIPKSIFQTPENIIFTIPKPIYSKPKFPLIKFLKVKSPKATKGFSGLTTEVRRYGKFKPVGSVSAGQSIVTGGLGATFRVRGKGAGKIRTPKGFRRKETSLGIEFIEEPKYRLSKKGEKIEIQEAKRRKKKRSLFDY